MKTTRLVLLSLATLATLSWGSTSQAAFAVRIYEDGNVGSAVTLTGTAGTPLNVIGTDIAYSDFYFVNFTATSNSDTATTQANITGTGTILSVNGGHSLTIEVSDDNFTMPAGGDYIMGSSSSYTAVADPPGSFTFGSFAGPGGTLFGMNTPSPGFTYSPLGPDGSNNEAATPFSYGPPFTLTESYTWSVPSGGDGSLFQPTGSTIAASAVPEPSSLAALGLGGLITVGALWRRRRVAD